MQQEQDTCRICSGPGEPEQPLFYPCKCSGTIRYIHQDCLKTWLDHSKKTNCDVCKYPYAFTKVYAPDMPDRVPITIIIRKFAEQVIAVILFMLRAVLVAFVWLTLLPYGTVLTWRLYFRMGDILAWWISLHPRPAISWSSTSNESLHTTPPSRNFPSNRSTLLQDPFLFDISFQPYVRTLSADIFTGQIIASLIVLAFLAVFLLREWIQQNARPGVFDDGPAPDLPAPINLRPQVEPQEVEHDVANIDDDPDHVPAEHADALEAAPGVPLAARPIPDVPEDVRTVSPSSSSSSSSDTEGPLRRHSPAVNLEGSIPTFEGRRRRIPKQQTGIRGVTARKRRVMDDERPDEEVTLMGARSHRIKREESESWELQLGEPSHPRGFNKGRTKSGRFEKPFGAGGSANDTDVMFVSGSKSGQKRKAEDDPESPNRPSFTPGSVGRSLSPSSADFEFTFKPPHSSETWLIPSTSALSQDGEFKFSPRDRASSQSSISSMPLPRLEPSSSPHPLTPGSSHAVRAGRFPSIYSSTATSQSPVFEIPALDEDNWSALSELPYSLTRGSASSLSKEEINRGTLAELPFPLIPRSSVPPPTPPDSVPSLGGLDSPGTEPSHLSRPSSPSSFASLSGFQSTQIPRRPPLPTSTLPPAETHKGEASSSTASTTAVVAPPPSPHLAIYRPPEELEAEDGDYFGDTTHSGPQNHDAEEEEDEEEDDDARFAYYFREPEQEEAREVPPPLLPDTDEEEDEEDGHELEVRPGGAVVDPPGEPLPAARNAAGQEADADIIDDERDQNLEEDLVGAMEAVGLRGPVFAVFQNAALMLFILNVSIGGGVWIPFTLGKTVALLTLEPRRAIQIVHLPIRAVRLVTDPSVDAIIYGLQLLSLSLIAWGRTVCLRASHTVGDILGMEQNWFQAFSQRIHAPPLLSLFMFTGGGDASPPRIVEATSWTLTRENMLSYVRLPQLDVFPAPSLGLFSFLGSSAFQFAEGGFSVLGRHVRVVSVAALKGWVELAEGDGTMERLWAILLGYAIAAFLAALYLNTITVGNVRSAGRAVRNAIRQQVIVLKVALFIIVELVMFPFGCGTMLDFSTLVLFPEATVESRVAFFMYAPITAAFYHWLIGTMFMYQFAILLATCREILRPGCMWFIKDPQDPTFHPIRDILDRPTFAQLRKLCMSAIMYAVVISFGVGSMMWSLNVIAPSTLPLRWKMREPLSEIPVDLLFVHLIIPPTLHYFRPRKPVRRLMTAWWRWTARQLRLTSFLFGGRHSDEEFRPVQWPWGRFFFPLKDQPDTMGVRDGGFRRAPAGDNIAFLRDRSVLVEVDEEGTPLNESAGAIIHAQDTEAQKAGRNVQDDYTIVYVPPNFHRRIILFILLFWHAGSIALVSAVAAPILSGRAVFRLFSSRELHDGYSFVVGFYLLWWSWLVGSLIVRVRVRRQGHEGSSRIRAGWFLFLLKRMSVYASKITWLFLWLGIVLPTLVSIVMDLYLVIPLRRYMNPVFTPTIHVVESWATGLIISKIIIRTQRTRPGTDLSGALEAIQRNGWRRPDPWTATRDFIIPVGTGLAGMILLPPLVIYGSSKLIVLPWKTEDLFRLIYPSIFVTVGVAQFAMSLVGVFSKWTQGIRDREFLVEMRLRNLDNPRKAEKPPSSIEPAEAQAEGMMEEED